jgi:nitric oxide reductase subunit C
MLSKSAARKFFLIGTALCSVSFLLLTADTIRRVPAQTNEANITEQVKRGKHLWDRNNCMGCHTLFGEGAYYAPELTKVYERRGEAFIKTLIKDPEAMYPGERKMVKYDFKDEDIDALVAFFKWVGEVDLNGWPPKPSLDRLAVPSTTHSTGGDVAKQMDRPRVFNQMCIACHALQGQGGTVGPALDDVGARRDYDNLVAWLKDPQAAKPGAKMPKLPLSHTDINELAAFLSKMKPGEKK